jgi:hypothetical protein
VAKIFLAFAFDLVNRARADSISSILRPLGHEVLLGDQLHGDRISTAVQDLVSNSDGLIAVLSRRDQFSDGGWSTHPWVIEEAAWAYAKGKMVLRVVEDGVTNIGGIAGDVEELRFPSGQFETCIPRLISFADYVYKKSASIPALRPVEVRQTYSVVPEEPVEDSWGDEVKELIWQTREKAKLELFQDCLELSNRAVAIDPKCWRAHLNRGVALVHLGSYKDAADAFDYVAGSFSDAATIVARALHNKAWLISMRDGLGEEKSLRIRKELYLQALALDNRRKFTRAMVLICMVLLHEEDTARPFLEASLKWKGFIDALREELDALGGLGLQVVQQLPEWLRDLLYPTEGTTQGGKRYES